MKMGSGSKILIIGGSGYLGKYMAKASISLSFPTFVYVRPLNPNSDPSKLLFHQEFQSLGVTVFEGELNEHEKLVSVLKQVDIVISTLAVPQYLDQLKIIDAIKQAGNIKRFIPSEYGNEVDRVSALPPFEAILENKRKIRRATEAAAIPYTFISANCFGAYFVDYFLHPNDLKSDHIIVYGTGQAKAVLNYEEDVAAYTVKAATDPRVENRLLIIRPPENIVSQLDLIASWEKKTELTFNRVQIPEQQITHLSQSLPHPDCIPVSILHSIFIKGDQTSFDLNENDLEASKLYPDYNYTCVDALLDQCLINPPKPKLATFA